MIPVAREISDLKGEFEGGSSFSIDWYVQLRKGAENTLDNINPDTLKRTVPIYGGLTRNLSVYYCPPDVETPTRLWTRDRSVYFDYMPAARFYAKQNFIDNCRNKFTIEYVNGVRFIVVYKSLNDEITVIDSMDSPVLDGQALSINSYNVLPGSTAALEGTFSDSGYTIGRDLGTVLDITNYLKGVVILPLYFDNAKIVESVKVRFYSTLEVTATGTLTRTATNVADGATVTIGTKTYRFKTVMAQAYDVQIGVDANTSFQNLESAIEANGTVGVQYYAGTVSNPDVIVNDASPTVMNIISTLVGAAGNNTVTTETSAQLSFGAATLTGGVTAVYYEMASTQDSIGDYFRDGQNFVRFWVNNAVLHETPIPSNIIRWEIDVKMTAGNEQNVILGKFTLQRNNLYFFEYQSNRMFIDPTSGAWSDTPATGYSINLDRDALGVFHYETARLVFNAASFSAVDATRIKSIETDLVRKYEQYFLLHPSAAQPLSYNISPDIPYSPDMLGEGVYDFDADIGGSTDSEQGGGGTGQTIYFMDGERPAGTFNDVNTIFTLTYAPDPALSLTLILNGQTLGAGIDFNLSGNVITFTSPQSASYENLDFHANYRYTI